MIYLKRLQSHCSHVICSSQISYTTCCASYVEMCKLWIEMKIWNIFSFFCRNFIWRQFFNELRSDNLIWLRVLNLRTLIHVIQQFLMLTDFYKSHFIQTLFCDCSKMKDFWSWDRDVSLNLFPLKNNSTNIINFYM